MSKHATENDAPVLIGTCPDGERCQASAKCVLARACTRDIPPAEHP